MIRQFASSIGIEGIIYLVGLTLFASWLLRTSLGRKSLAETEPRRNNMPIYLPFVPLFIWLGAVSVAMQIKRGLMGDLDPRGAPALQNWQSAFLDNLILCIGAIVTIVVIIFLARATFARRLKGFGLNVRTIHKDLSAAFVNLLSIWPLLFLTIILTAYFGKVFFGQDYEMPQHEELKLITAHPQLLLKILIVITAVVIAPVIEEMLFRGLFQTMIRSYLENWKLEIGNWKLIATDPVWVSIAISSMIFTTVHYNMAHWPALFVLALCLGYAYEKSGSLLRPIFIHSLFNAITIVAVLNQ